MPTLHFRYNGESHDLDFSQVFTPERLQGIGFTGEFTGNALTPDQVKMAVAQNRDIGVAELEDFSVEYQKSGDIVVRPDAVFG